jgi:dihydroorotate dehydrogenase (NAD+) catalytic subunit
MPNQGLQINLAGLQLKNPLLPASGTYGYGREYLPFFTPDVLGAVVTKGVAVNPWAGNPPPRVCETPSGMLNAIGLQNPGVEQFIAEALPFLRQYQIPVIVNIVGRTIPEYVAVAERLNDFPEVSGFELNISCPNVKEGGIAFGTDPQTAHAITAAVRKVTKRPLIVKLSPNVTDITEIAQQVEAAGADALSLINTLLGMKIDLQQRRPFLGNLVGGLSGPAIKPVALRMVWQVYRKVAIPIVGMGGISSAQDALEFIMAGATAVAIGTILFRNPYAPQEILEGIAEFMVKEKVDNIAELVGVAQS